MPTTKKRIKKGKNSSKNLDNSIKSEVVSIISITLSIFFSIAIFIPNAGGFIGSFINDVSRGLFGVGAFAIPFVAVGISVYIFFNKPKKFLASKFIILFTLFCLIITSIHIANTSNYENYSIFSVFGIFIDNFGTGFIANGGLVGAVIGATLLAVVGRIGSYIILLAFSIILCVLLTGRSFISLLTDIFYFFRNQYDRIAEHKDTDDDYDDEMQEEFKEKVVKLEPKKRIHLVHEDILLNSKKQAHLNNKPTGVIVGNISPNDSYNKPLRDEVFINTSPINSNDVYEKINTADETDESGNIDTSEDEHKSHENFDLSKFDKSFEDEYIYMFPPVELLGEKPVTPSNVSKSQIFENSQKLEETLKSFGVVAKVVEINKGPTVTRYEISPGAGVKVSKISGLADDLALNLAANGIRIEAPIPGKSAVGIEVPNKEAEPVYFREVIESDIFKDFPSNLAFALGKDIAGNVVVSDIGKMPHLLIAGATGSGKSVCINTLIVSLIYKSSPEDVKLIMIDPKVVELSVYNGIPHLMIPVVTDPKKAASALNWAVKEMLNRYELFATANVRDLKGYNDTIKSQDQPTLPQIVIIIDELADLMMAAPGEVEDAICRLAQMARAAGLHLIIATQRPSVDVITGVIKANVPSRLAFSVSSGTDSRTILDSVGAEKLLGRGDMLFCPIGMNKPLRIQGAFIKDKEVESIVEFLKAQSNKTYSQEIIDTITSSSKAMNLDEDLDEFFEEAVEFVIEKDKASASLLQRQFRIGYQRASRLMDSLEDKGIIGVESGSKARKVLITSAQWENLKNGNATEESNNDNDEVTNNI